MDRYSFQNKTILITGASKGLGQVCAEAFAQEGSRLILAARSEDRLMAIRKSLLNKQDHVVFAGDLCDPTTIAKLAEKAKEAGGVDVILHCLGGGLGMRDPLLKWGEFDALYRTNLASGAELNRLLVPDMITRKAGNIVHVGSVTSTDAVGSVGYNSVKAGVAAYVRTLGRELAETGIIVTGVLPGAFFAPENAWVRLQRLKPDIVEKFIKERMPRKRIGDASEIVPLLLFLCSPQATMMSGCCVPIDGGEGISYVGD